MRHLSRRPRLAPVLALAIAAPLMLAGCGGAAEEPETTPSVEDTVPATTEPAAEPAAEPVDHTAELQAAAGDVVTSALETQPGYYVVETTIVDPRGDAGSPAAVEAIAVCEAAVALGATQVNVAEADGTSFVLYGHPAYGDTCTEV